MPTRDSTPRTAASVKLIWLNTLAINLRFYHKNAFWWCCIILILQKTNNTSHRPSKNEWKYSLVSRRRRPCQGKWIKPILCLKTGYKIDERQAQLCKCPTEFHLHPAVQSRAGTCGHFPNQSPQNCWAPLGSLGAMTVEIAFPWQQRISPSLPFLRSANGRNGRAAQLHAVQRVCSQRQNENAISTVVLKSNINNKNVGIAHDQQTTCVRCFNCMGSALLRGKLPHCLTTPHQKGTQDGFWIPIKIPAEYGSLMPIIPENEKMKKICKGTLTNKF